VGAGGACGLEDRDHRRHQLRALSLVQPVLGRGVEEVEPPAGECGDEQRRTAEVEHGVGARE